MKEIKGKVSPWIPITNKRQVKALGKLMEELGECSAAAARTLIQGDMGVNPSTGELNREWLTNELADVLAHIHVVTTVFMLNFDLIIRRAGDKQALQEEWMDQLPTNEIIKKGV